MKRFWRKLRELPMLESKLITLIVINLTIQHPFHNKASNQKLSRTRTELRYFEPSLSMKEVNNQSLWNFELDSQGTLNFLIWITIGFQQTGRKDSQNLNKDIFCRFHVTSAQCVIGTEKYPDADIRLIYDDDEYFKGYGQIKEASIA